MGTAARQCEGAECHRTGALGTPAGRPHLPSQLSGPMLDVRRCRSGSRAPQPNTAHGALTGPAAVQPGLQRLGQAPAAHSDDPSWATTLLTQLTPHNPRLQTNASSSKMHLARLVTWPVVLRGHAGPIGFQAGTWHPDISSTARNSHVATFRAMRGSQEPQRRDKILPVLPGT